LSKICAQKQKDSVTTASRKPLFHQKALITKTLKTKSRRLVRQAAGPKTSKP
jgi:hypothetical protein